MSRDADDENFSDGLSEEIINALTQVRGLKVIARTAAFAFKGRTKTSAGFRFANSRRRQNVAFPVQGRRRRHPRGRTVARREQGPGRRCSQGSGSRIRVTVQLINVADAVIDGRSGYESDLSDICASHDDISTAVQRSLQSARAGSEYGRSQARAGHRRVQPVSAGTLPVEEEDRRGIENRARPLQNERRSRPNFRTSTGRHRGLLPHVGDVGRRGAGPMHAQGSGSNRYCPRGRPSGKLNVARAGTWRTE